MLYLRRSRSLLLLASLVACSACGANQDPPPGVTRSWATSEPLPVARFEAYAAVARGRIYFLGGITGVFGDMSTAQPSRRVDVFDPETRAWSTGPELPSDAPKHHLSVAVWNEAIYVLGGFDGILGQRPNEPFLPIAVAYVLEGTVWRKLAPPPLARGGATAQAIDGRIYLTGGAPNEGEPSFASLDIYDIASDRWRSGAAMPTAREHLASCAVSGTMIVVGGWKDGPRIAQPVAEQYVPAFDRWVSLPPMGIARGGLAAVAIGSSCHVVGGEDWALPMPGTFTTHEVFETATGRWTTDVPMPTPRHGLGLAWTGGALYAVGGGPSQGNSYTAIVESLRP